MTTGPERPFRYLDCPNHISTPSIIPVTRVTKDYNAQSFRISILVNINTTCWLKLNSQWRHFIIHQIYLQMCTTDIGSQAGLILSSETPMLALPPSIHTECHRWSSTTEGRLPALIAWWHNSQWNQRHQYIDIRQMFWLQPKVSHSQPVILRTYILWIRTVTESPG